jgi:hypothetical protein
MAARWALRRAHGFAELARSCIILDNRANMAQIRHRCQWAKQLAGTSTESAFPQLSGKSGDVLARIAGGFAHAREQRVKRN